MKRFFSGYNISFSGLERREYDHRHPSRWPRGTLYPQKLALTSPTSGGRSVVIVCSRTQNTEFSFFSFFNVSIKLRDDRSRLISIYIYGCANQNASVQTSSPVRAVRRITRAACWLSAQSSQSVPVPQMWVRLPTMDSAEPCMSTQPIYMMSSTCSQVRGTCISCEVCNYTNN
jgi:hypothetical protein